MLTHFETIELIEKAKQNDEKAKEKLIINNTQLVKSIANKYKYNQIDYDDLMQLGYIGLYKAIMNFDISYDVKFSTYAVPMISGEIKRFLRDDGIIKVSRQTKVLSSKIQAYINETVAIKGSAPSAEDIAKTFNIECSEIPFILDSIKYPISIYEKADEDSSQCLIDKIASSETSDDLINKILIKDYIKMLPDKEKKVIILRFYRDKTQSEIASLLGVSQVQVSRIENKVILMLREKFLNNQ